MTSRTPATINSHTPEQLEAIVVARCSEVAEAVGWPVTPPTIRLLDSAALADAIAVDVGARSLRTRGGPRRPQGLLSKLASSLLQLFGRPCTLGYFATGTGTVLLDSNLAPPQAGYVLMHELTHAAQYQNFSSYFDEVDAARVRAEDLADDDGASSESASARDRYEALLTLLEGHATLVGRRALEERVRRELPTGSVDAARELVAALTGLDPHDETTQLVYLRGERMLAGMDASRWEELFRSPEQSVQLFGRYGR